MGNVLELSDTIGLMTSDDYKDRFKAEYLQLKIRYEKLLDMLGRWDSKLLDFEPTCPRSTYDMQVKAMADYLAVLKARAVMEGVEL